MSIYVFSILSWYELGGVDIAQARRDKYFSKLNEKTKYIFTDIPHEIYIERYQDYGISKDKMLSAHVFMTGKNDLSGEITVDDYLEKIKENIPNINVVYKDNTIHVYTNQKRVAILFLRPNNTIHTVNHYDSERLIAQDIYADRLLWRSHYITSYDNKGRAYAKCTRTTFVDSNGNTCFEVIPTEVKDINPNDGDSADERDYELYLFPNGERITKIEFLKRFLEKLAFTEKDTIILDRPMRQLYIQPLFEMQPKAPIIIFLHSGHYYEPNEDPDALYWNKEYYYYFKYSRFAKAFVVSTKAQKINLEYKLKEYDRDTINIYVIPASGLDNLTHPLEDRKPYSLLTASRLHGRKRIDLIIKAVILAHHKNPNITLDIYGKGENNYQNELQTFVTNNNASDYIHFMGRCDMKDKYKNYECFITASTWETLGLSMMEAVSSGNALIGWDAKYGNTIFIQNSKNGISIPMKPEDFNNPILTNKHVEEMAEAIITLFSDYDKLRQYQEYSYEIAKDFLDENIENKWIQLIKSVHSL